MLFIKNKREINIYHGKYIMILLKILPKVKNIYLKMGKNVSIIKKKMEVDLFFIFIS